MNRFKQIIKSRIAILVLFNSVLIILVTAGIFHPTAGSTQNIADFMSGFNTGLYLLMQVALIYFISKYVAASRNSEKLKELYIYENDERRKLMKSQIGGFGINIILFGLGIASVAAGFWNETVYFTLLFIFAFTAFLKGAMKLYYNRSM